VDERSLCFRVLELDGLYASLIVQVASILIIRDTLRELGLHHEVASLLVQVLLQIGANDDIHGCGLPNLILVQAAILVGLEDKRTDLR